MKNKVRMSGMTGALKPMNTRDIGQQKAYEILREMDIPPDLAVQGVTMLSLATVLFINGWTYGIQDAQRCYVETVTDAQTDEQIRAGFQQLKRILNSAVKSTTVSPKSRG